MHICRHIGCEAEFVHRMQRNRHEADCKQPKPEKENKVPIYEKTDNNKYLCVRCKKEFSQKPAVFKHVREKRCKSGKQKKQQYQCTTCEKVFANKSKLDRHEAVHTRTEQVCWRCLREFKRSDHYEKHTKQCNDVYPSFLRSADDLIQINAHNEVNDIGSSSTVDNKLCGVDAYEVIAKRLDMISMS